MFSLEGGVRVYPTYNNQYYIQDLQNMKDRIDKQLQHMTQPQQQTPITQNFQLTPPTNQISMRFANTIDDVNKELVFGDTPFFNKEMSIVWIKNVKGEIKSYALDEIIQKDDKDMMIESLQMQIDELKKGLMNNAKSITSDDDEPTQSKKSTTISSSRTSSTKSK